MNKLEEEYNKIVVGELELLNKSKNEVRIYIEKFETKPAIQQAHAVGSDQSKDASPDANSPVSESPTQSK